MFASDWNPAWFGWAQKTNSRKERGTSQSTKIKDSSTSRTRFTWLSPHLLSLGQPYFLGSASFVNIEKSVKHLGSPSGQGNKRPRLMAAFRAARLAGERGGFPREGGATQLKGESSSQAACPHRLHSHLTPLTLGTLAGDLLVLETLLSIPLSEGDCPGSTNPSCVCSPSTWTPRHQGTTACSVASHALFTGFPLLLKSTNCFSCLLWLYLLLRLFINYYLPALCWVLGIQKK